MANKEKKRNPRRFYRFAKFFIWCAIRFVAPSLLKKNYAEVEHYTPKNKTFIIIANHSDILDPGYQMISLNRYVRFVAADWLITYSAINKLLLDKMYGVIVKHRDLPPHVLTDEILENLKAGIPVGLQAEGLVTTNGETGFISPNTGKLVKDSGVALITYKITGGYLRKPRWAETKRTGDVFGKVVHEYSPEELQNYSVEEINEIIRRDIYVNAFEQQRMHPHVYKGERLAEFCERTIYVCPKCNGVSTLHSHDDEFACECGYKVTYGEDCFFHGDDVVFDNVLDWDKWQRKKWKEILTTGKGLIYSEGGQIVYRVVGKEKTKLCSDATLNIYPDKFEIVMDNETVSLNIKTMKRVQNSGPQNLVLIDENSTYYLLDNQIPRASDKYVAAWYYLNGREYQ